MQFTINGQTELDQIKSASPRGFTKDCFYTEGEPADYVTGSPQQSRQCCCVSTLKSEPSSYYQIDDVAKYDSSEKIHESKSADSGPQALDDMKWSYRYSRIKYEAVRPENSNEIHNSYNPLRYIEDRDKYACFGQNAIIKKDETIEIGCRREAISISSL